jgi:catechol 2,3-dioxygenase-like lactoylglutathione lyase family enzyme
VALARVLIVVSLVRRRDVERGLGIGGIFFKARDPQALATWYHQHLGIPIEPGQTYGTFCSEQAGEVTVWSASPTNTVYFAPSPAPFMVNYRVRDLEAMLAQLSAAGAVVGGQGRRQPVDVLNERLGTRGHGVILRGDVHGTCVFLPYSHRGNLPAGSVIYDVSSYADFPYCTLSPMWPHGGIPVPGMPGTTSDSVEGIWQGLKVIRGEIAPRYFSGPGPKRGGKPSGLRLGKSIGSAPSAPKRGSGENRL